MKVSESKCIQKYKCLIQDCELSCCAGWRIAVSKEDVEKWKEKAPQLMRFLNTENNENGEATYSMKREKSITVSLPKTQSTIVKIMRKKDIEENKDDTNENNGDLKEDADIVNNNNKDAVDNNTDDHKDDASNALNINSIENFINSMSEKDRICYNSTFSLRCIANVDGKCKVQLEHGEDMIPNLCSYFPHTYKKNWR